ncbi:MAG: T9SS type A sorting domain-containing protein, partial [Bacteroidota bacterium]
LQGGVSYYRARLKRIGKPDILTYEAELLFADETTCLVFPNPATPGQPITVLTNGEDLEITFFDSAGKRMESMELVGQVFRPEIRFDAVPGLYFYQVRRRGKQLGAGRLLLAPR